MSDITIFLNKLRTDPENIQFSDVIALIDAHYDHIPTVFSNGTMINEATQNQGSAKVFSFARIHNLSEIETLQCFAEHFRDVEANPDGNNHQNIRQFIANGWAGIRLPDNCLTTRSRISSGIEPLSDAS